MQSELDLLADTLRDLSEQIGEDCTPDANGVITFSSGPIAISIETRPADRTAYFHAPVGRLNELPKEAALSALAWNLFSQSQPGSWLAFDRETDELVLCHAAEKSGLTARGIVTILDALASTAEDLVATLGRPARPADETGRGDDAETTFIDFIRV